MIKLNKAESEVFNAILATGAADADSIAYESSLSKVKVKSILKTMIEKSAVYSFTDGDEVMFDITGADVEMFNEDTSHLTEEVVEQPTTEQPTTEQPTTEVAPKSEKKEKKAKKEKEDIDLSKFTKNGQPRKVTNAMRVREKIAEVKAEMSKEEAEMTVVQFCMEQLGQSKQLARTYFKDNYDRVE